MEAGDLSPSTWLREGLLLMSRNTQVTLVLEEDRIRVQGGRLIPGDDPAS